MSARGNERSLSCHLQALTAHPRESGDPDKVAPLNPFLVQCGGTAALPRIGSNATIGNFDQTQEFRDVLLRGAAAGDKRHIGLGVKRLAAVQNRDEVFHRARADDAPTGGDHKT